MDDQQLLFDDRFLEKYAGHKILNDPITALIELIANSWDAGATEVNIFIPLEYNQKFIINDNGCGLSSEEFERIWSTLYYDRTKYHGKYAIDIASRLSKQRKAFGRNGIGRCAAFCFGDEYNVISSKNGKQIEYSVSSIDPKLPFNFEKITENESENTGTVISVIYEKKKELDLDHIRSEIGMRFLSDPEFKIFVQRRLVSFEDIYSDNVEEVLLDIDDVEAIKIIIIDTKDTDRTTKHHGIAWRVNNRLVGDISWNSISGSFHIDGRRIESRRYSFVVFVDFLEDDILADWSGFDSNKSNVIKVEEAVYKFISLKLLDLSKGQREETFSNVKKKLGNAIKKMSPLREEIWKDFITKTQEQCPSITEKELVNIGEILINLEVSKSKYNLLDQLKEFSSNDLDDLDEILKDWSIDYAKIVLDELKNRSL